jgi:hypothetical protein
MDSDQTNPTVSFAATIYKLGINPCVDVPERVSEAYGRRGFVPVEATLHGHTFHVTLVPRGSGRHRLFINGEMRRTAGVDTGDTVHIGLRLDTEPRDIPVPEDLREALRAVNGASEAFDQLTPSHRKELLRWVLDAKRPETRARRIRRVIEHMMG